MAPSLSPWSSSRVCGAGLAAECHLLQPESLSSSGVRVAGTEWVSDPVTVATVVGYPCHCHCCRWGAHGPVWPWRGTRTAGDGYLVGVTAIVAVERTRMSRKVKRAHGQNAPIVPKLCMLHPSRDASQVQGFRVARRAVTHKDRAKASVALWLRYLKCVCCTQCVQLT